MYKVSEVAEMLSVEKVKIFEALIVHDEILSPYVTKERHLSYISEVGVRKLEQLLFTGYIVEEEIIEEVEIEDPLEEVIEEEVPDQLDVFIEKAEAKKNDLRNEIVDIKRHLNSLDKDIKYKCEAVASNQLIFSDDLKYVHELMERIKQVSYKKESTKQTFFSKMKK